MSKDRSFWRVVAPLGLTQIASWGSLFYAFALLAPHMQQELGWSAEVVFGAFSWSMLVAGLAAAPAGWLIDRFGGRRVLSAGSLICSAGLVLLSSTHTPLHYYAAWTLVGIGTSMVLYEAAFAVVNRQFELQVRTGISVVTLFGGFASTVFWPASLYLQSRFGWRGTYLTYAIIQLVVCLPLHLSLPASKPAVLSQPSRTAAPDTALSLKQALSTTAFWLLALAFATNSFIFSALSVHLISLLGALGHPTALVVLLAAFIGPMQVAGRVAEMVFARRLAPEQAGVLTFAVLSAALAVLLFMASRQWAVALFCILYGLSNGVLTIVRGMIPQKLFGRENYGAISGALTAPVLITKAAAPLAIGALVGAGLNPETVLLVLLAVSLASLWAYLAAVRTTAPDALATAQQPPQ